MFKTVADYSVLEIVALAILNPSRLVASDLLHVPTCVINLISSLFV